MTGSNNILARIGRRSRLSNRTWCKLGGTQKSMRQPKVPEGSESEPTGKDKGSRSNAQYRGARSSKAPGPDAWGTKAQGTHDNT